MILGAQTERSIQFIADISSLIQSNFKDEIKIVGFANSVKEAVKIINKKLPNLIIIDICLDDGSAFDVLSNIDHKTNIILLLKEKDQSIEKMLDFFSVRFFIKPTNKNLYVEFILKLFKEYPFDNEENLNKGNIANYSNHCLKNKIILTDNQGYKIIDITKVTRCEVIDNCTIFYCCDGSHFTFIKTLICLEKILMQSEFPFFRIHNNHLINLEYFNTYIKKDGGKVLMNDGTILPVSYRRRNALLSTLKNQINFIK